MHPAHAIKLNLCTRKVNISEGKIDRSHLNTFKIVIADYLFKDKFEKIEFF